jgi:fatty-acyl-CoA synthase
MNACYSTTTAIHQNENDSLCLVLPLFHIFGLQCGLISSAVTDSIVVLPRDIKTSTLIDVVSSKKCTILHSVPTLVFAIVNNKDFSSEKMSSLRSTILAGAAASASQIEMLREKFPNNHFGISYGLSEMAPVTITEYEDTIEHITTTVGKPVENIEISIRNIATGENCPAGSEGEILVRGHNLMCYYYKVDLEQQSIDEEGWLHTGDLGYIDNNGYVHFVGRIKELIIRGGENIYPNEIASVISAQEEIADVKVLGAPDDFWGETVEAAIVLKQGVSFNAENFKEKLGTLLAKHKLPDNFFIYEQFPTLANGKIDALTLKKEIAEKVKLIKEK